MAGHFNNFDPKLSLVITLNATAKTSFTFCISLYTFHNNFILQRIYCTTKDKSNTLATNSQADFERFQLPCHVVGTLTFFSRVPKYMQQNRIRFRALFTEQYIT